MNHNTFGVLYNKFGSNHNRFGLPKKQGRKLLFMSIIYPYVPILHIFQNPCTSVLYFTPVPGWPLRVMPEAFLLVIPAFLAYMLSDIPAEGRIYILAEDDAIQGLQQTRRFEQIKKADVFKNDTESGSEYFVYAEVISYFLSGTASCGIACELIACRLWDFPPSPVSDFLHLL
ncbi:hypothetical protein JOC94_001514 [Bacillus thermophilus]|uniref:Uncharacterized protein n=1 Tax=Siminovitchia thermophila TaxID=1245522 RepID=A0ABS2R4K2_9BACI|nr:hypothetical protein [Siminovitchia thermophila]MBM7714542.1 hypothetical protein [Siminovitchia thermophila]ONK22603.1 hypothetical protein BLX87_14555 [Bacillus sp. VT-16-64]